LHKTKPGVKFYACQPMPLNHQAGTASSRVRSARRGTSRRSRQRRPATRARRPRAPWSLPHRPLPRRRARGPGDALALVGEGRRLLARDRAHAPRALRRPAAQGEHDAPPGLGQAAPSRSGGRPSPYGDIKKDERVDIGAIPVTNVRHTLIDCIDAHVSFEHIDVALRQATARKLLVARHREAREFERRWWPRLAPD
jgi:hypothetical protein